MEIFGLIITILTTVVTAIAAVHTNEIISIAPSQPQVSHFVNDSHIVFCRSLSKHVKIQWKAPNGNVIDINKGRIHIEEKQGQLALVFEHIAVGDMGQWTCEIIGGGAQKTFELLVNQKISFMDSDQVQSVKEGRDATILCRVNGDPKPTISWYRNGDVIKFPNPKSKQLADGLFIKSVIQMDAGEYTCRAFQISETVTDVQEQTILLKIQHKPIWTNNDTTNIQYGYIDGLVNLTCEAIAEPLPAFKWVHNGKSIISQSEGYRSILQINVKNDSQFGEYKCKVANPLGTLERTIKLKKGIKPNGPDTFRLRRLYSDSFELDIRSRRISDIPENMEVNGYRVEYMTENEFKFVAGNWTFARKKDFSFGKDHQFIVNELEKNTSYYIRAASKNLAGLSDWTNVVIYTTAPSSALKLITYFSFMMLFIFNLILNFQQFWFFNLF